MNNIVKKKNTADEVKQLVLMAMFIALTYLANFICNFKLGFLSFEAKDAITVMCSYSIGPLAGVIVAFVSAVIESITASGTGIYGFLMNIFGSITYVGIAGAAYKFKKNIVGTAVGVSVATLAMTAVMIVFNIIITPFYMGVPRGEVVKLIMPMLLPFNLVKGIFNSAVILIIRYPVLKALQLAGVMNEPVEKDKESVRNTVLIVSGLLAVLTVLYFVIVLNGRVDLFVK